MIICGDCMSVLKEIEVPTNSIFVSDPPFNVGFHYNSYNDNMDSKAYFDMLNSIFKNKRTIPS